MFTFEKSILLITTIMIKYLFKNIFILCACLIPSIMSAQDSEKSDLKSLNIRGQVKKIFYYKADFVMGKVMKEYLSSVEWYTPKGYLISRYYYDIDGNVTYIDSCTYNKAGDKVEVKSGHLTNGFKLSQSFKYDSNHNMIESIRYGMNEEEVQKFTYTIANNRRISWSWYSKGNLIRKYDNVYNKKGELIECRYDTVVYISKYDNGDLVSVEGNDGYSYSAEYDKHHNVLKETTSGMGVTTYKYQDGFFVESIWTRPDNDMTRMYFKGRSVLRKTQKVDKYGNPTEKVDYYSDGAGTEEKVNSVIVCEYEYYN